MKNISIVIGIIEKSLSILSLNKERWDCRVRL